MNLLNPFETIKSLLRITDTEQDDILKVYINLAEGLIVSLYYDDDIDTILTNSDTLLVIEAVIDLWNKAGAEGSKSVNDGGVTNTFAYANMREFILANKPNRVIVV